MSRAPIYAFVVPHLAPRARALGYALAVHGSLARDLDLVAVPWTPEAAPAEELVRALMLALGWAEDDQPNGPTEQPHGRRSWSLPLHAGLYVDLSVMPRCP